jgi:hypothetical protein
MACVKDLESSAKVKQLLGATPKVEMLDLACDLGDSPDCTSLTADSQLAWRGVSLEIELPCNHGVVELPHTVATEIAEVRRFVESRAMRTLVQMSTSDPYPVRVWNNGVWMSEGRFDDAPAIWFRPGEKAIHVQAISEHGPAAAAYLRALGIDLKTQHPQPDMSYKTDVEVDFEGKLLKP